MAKLQAQLRPLAFAAVNAVPFAVESQWWNSWAGKDSVSAVDTRTEKIILDNLKTSRAGKTTLLIAHRISTVEQLDKIVFIEDGRVEAVGPHDELYRSCAEYRRMVDLQKLEDEEGGGSHG